VAAGADVKAVNDSLDTPLHFAAHASDDIVKFLAEKGAPLDAKDKQGRTPVEMALGVGLHGHAGGPPAVREGTANLLRQLMASSNNTAAAPEALR
jgi:Ankyrin repeats (many copies)